MNAEERGKLRQLAGWLRESRYAVFFGGAGVSTESGIPDFRSEDGLYRMKYAYPPETILSHDFFVRNPGEFFRFYREKMLCPQAKPNGAHTALAQLEQRGTIKAVITQNIDGLHQAAGSREVLELHGSTGRNFCTRCHRAYTTEEMLRLGEIPRCPCGGVVKPDVVLYGEALDEQVIGRAVAHIRRADLLIVGGTSLTVYPAAGCLDYFQGKYLILMNRDETPRDDRADLIIRTPIGASLAEVVRGGITQ